MRKVPAGVGNRIAVIGVWMIGAYVALTLTFVLVLTDLPGVLLQMAMSFLIIGGPVLVVVGVILMAVSRSQTTIPIPVLQAGSAPVKPLRDGPSYTQAVLIPLAGYVGSIALGLANSCNALLGVGIIGGELSLFAFVVFTPMAAHGRALRQGKEPGTAMGSAIAVGVACALLALFPAFATLMLFMASDGCGAW